MKKQICESNSNYFDVLSEEIILSIFDSLNDHPLDTKSFSRVCKSFYAIESQQRKILRPLRLEHLTKILNRYPHITHLDLSLCSRVTESSLPILLRNCGNLVEIDFSNASELKDMTAIALAEAKNLESLKLVKCKYLTDSGIGCIAMGCRKLKLINLRGCLGVGDLGVGLIAVHCKEIRGLDLSYLPVTNKCLSSIFKLQYLEDLVLEGCSGIDDDGLVSLKREHNSLKKLDMSSCQNVSHTGLSSLTASAGCLRKLILANGSPIVADSLWNLSMLQSIILDGCEVSYSGLKAIGSSCVSLTELSLSKCVGVTDDGLCFIVAKHRELRKLDITRCHKITPVSIFFIANSCASLTSLRMKSRMLVPRNSFVLIGKHCQYLDEIDVTDSEIDDEGLKSISMCSNLSSLKLGFCMNITDQGLIHVGMHCSNLKELDLCGSTLITDRGISAISHGCASLEVIHISYCFRITDQSFVALSKCSKLSTLESRGCPSVTSLGLISVAAGCKQLSKLDVKECHCIGDAGMIPLAHFSQNLKQIDLSFTSVTDIGLLSLASIGRLQNITVLHQKGLTPGGLGAALLACGGLAKIKLQTLFKSLLPQPLLEHLEACGCVFEWKDETFQAEVDPKFWKLMLDNSE